MSIKNLWTLPALGLAVLLGGCFGPDEAESIAKAKEFEAKGEIRSAAIELKNVLQENPQQGEARFLLGRLSLVAGQPAAAEKEFEQAERHGYESPQLPLLLAQSRMAQAKYSDVINGLDSARFSGEQQVQALVLLGYANVGLNNYEEASRFFGSALGQSFDSIGAVVGLAVVERGRGNPDKAQEYLSRALQIDPDDQHANLVQGELYAEQGEYARAQAVFRKVIDSRPQGQAMTGRVFSASLGLIQALWRNQEVDKARFEVDRLIKEVPNHPRPLLLRASIAFSEQDLDQAESLLQKVLQLQPSNRQATFILGAVNFNQGKYEQANMHLTNFVAAEPDNERARHLLAQTRLKLEKPGEVIEALQPMVDAGGANPGVMGLLARANFQLGDAAAGLDVLEQTVAENPDNVQLKLQLAAGYLEARKYAEAITLLNKLPSADDPLNRRETLLFVAYLRSDQQSRAEGVIRNLLKAKPDSAPAHVLAGGLQQSIGKLGQARSLFEKALALEPDNVAALSNLGRLDYNERKFAAAQGRFERILQLQPASTAAREALGELAQAQGQTAKAIEWYESIRASDPQAANARLKLIGYYIPAARLDDAEAVARELLQANPAAAGASNAMGLVQLARGNATSALNRFKAAADADPANADYQLNQARAYIVQNKLDEARGALEQGLYLREGDATIAVTLADVHFRQGKANEAYAIAERLQKANPKDATGFALEGNLALNQGRNERAVAAFDKALALRSETLLMVKKHDALKNMESPDLIPALQRWLGGHPGDNTVRALLAQVYLEAGQFDQATREYERILETQPDSTVVLNNLAWLYDQSRNPDALKMAERAYRNGQSNWAVMDTYGWLLVRNGQVQEGIDILRKAAESTDASPEVSYHLAAALHRSGATGEVRALLERAVNSGTDFPEKDQARKLLGDLN